MDRVTRWVNRHERERVSEGTQKAERMCVYYTESFTDTHDALEKKKCC